MATHSSSLAWKIPQKEEPGRLQFMGHKQLNMTMQFHSNCLQNWLLFSLHSLKYETPGFSSDITEFEIHFYP